MYKLELNSKKLWHKDDDMTFTFAHPTSTLLKFIFCLSLLFLPWTIVEATEGLQKPTHSTLIESGQKEISLPASLRHADYKSGNPVVVVVDKSAHVTHAIQLQQTTKGLELVEVLAIPNGLGKPATPTPTGKTKVINKAYDPVWYPPESIDPKRKPVAPFKDDPSNSIGVMWIGLSESGIGKKGIGLHGTNEPEQIGKNLGHGCVRHQNEDILKLAPMLKVGTVVYLVEHFKGTKVLVVELYRT
jgi:hypothetical protein